MKLINFLITTTILTTGTWAQAQDYECATKVNVERGFDRPFEIKITPAAVGGQMLMTVDGKTNLIGTVSQADVLDSADPNMRDAFAATLGFIWEEDVSGIPAANIDKATRLQIYGVQLPSGDSAAVYQIFEGQKQVGGTFMAAFMATACLPK